MVRRVAQLFKPYKLQVGIVGLTLLLTSGIGAANPILSKYVIDSALFPRVHLNLLYTLVGLMVGIAVVQTLIGVGQTYLTTVVGQKVMQDLRNHLYEHLQSMSLRFFTATRTGEIQSRLQNDVGGVQSVVTNTASSILSNVVIIASSLVAMAVLSWQLTILSLILIPAFVYLTYRVGKVRRQIAKETQESLAEMSALTEETLSVSGILLAKVFDRQRDATERYRRENRRLALLQVRQQMVGRSFFALVSTFFSIAPALTYLVGGLANAHGTSPHVTAGTLVAFTALQTRLFFPVGQMLQVSTEVQSSLALFERIFNYLDLEKDIVDADGALAIPKADVRGQVRFRDVRFRYEEPVLPPALEGQAVQLSPDGNGVPRREWTLDGVDFEIEPGELAAIVGPSGAGKTTISYLVPRLYDVTDGSVEIDGVDVRELQLASLADLVGMVTQETYLFHSRVRENLLYARPDATE